MRTKFIPALRRKRVVDMNSVIYHQDGAPPHCSDRSLEYLRQCFRGDRLISRRTDFPWPPYSPDLNPPDYFLWGYLKERIYNNNPKTLADLKGNTKSEIKKIPSLPRLRPLLPLPQGSPTTTWLLSTVSPSGPPTLPLLLVLSGGR